MNKKLLASLFAVGLAAGCVCSSVDAHGVFFANRTDCLLYTSRCV